jgi:hypothetical protein
MARSASLARRRRGRRLIGPPPGGGARPRASAPARPPRRRRRSVGARPRAPTSRGARSPRPWWGRSRRAAPARRPAAGRAATADGLASTTASTAPVRPAGGPRGVQRRHARLDAGGAEGVDQRGAGAVALHHAHGVAGAGRGRMRQDGARQPGGGGGAAHHGDVGAGARELVGGAGTDRAEAGAVEAEAERAPGLHRAAAGVEPPAEAEQRRRRVLGRGGQRARPPRAAPGPPRSPPPRAAPRARRGGRARR